MNSVRSVLLASLAVAAAATIAPAGAQQPQPVGPYKDFNGTINLDIRDLKADWGPFTPKKAPPGAPNILFVLYDDTGLAAWSTYGGRINMPTLDQLAQNGIDLHAVAHRGALFADPVDAADGAQPHFERHGRDHGGLQRLSGLGGSHPAASRYDRAGASRQWLQHILARQESQRAGAGCRRGRRPQDLAARSGISSATTDSSAARPINGIRTWSRTITSSSRRPHRSRATTSPRISPIRPSR